MAIQFDPTKYGATPVVSSNASGFDPSKYKAVRVTPPDSELDNSTLGNLKSIAKNIPGAAKQVFTEPFKHPIKTLQAVTAGAGDVGVGIANLGLKLSGSKTRLPSLSKAFSEAQTSQEQQDVLGSIGEGSKMYSSFALGQKGVDKYIKNPIARGVIGNVVGGQMVADADATAKERGTQALFDAAFGAITEGTGPLTKKLFGKKVPPPKEKLTAEQYSASQGYEPIIPDEQLPVIKAGKTPKEPTVKYGKTNPKVFDEGFTAPDGQPPIPTKSVLPGKGQIEAPSPQEPLMAEARKYKSAEEFVRKESFNPNSRFEYHISDNPNLTEGKLFSEQVKPTNIGERGFAGKEENIEQIFSTKNPQQWSAQLNYEGNKKPQYVYLVEVKNPAKVDIMDGLPHQSINSPADVKILKKVGGEEAIKNPSIGESVKQSQLTDIYNKAVKETIPVQQSFDDIIKEKATPKFKKEVVELSKQLDEIPGYTPKQKVREAAAFKNYTDTGNTDHIIKVAQGIIKDDNMTAQTAFALGEAHFDKTQDWENLLKISKSNEYSKPGQGLSMLNQGDGASGGARALIKARHIKEQALLKKGIDVEKEITQHLDDAVKDIKAGKDVNSVIDDLIDSFTCI